MAPQTARESGKYSVAIDAKKGKRDLGRQLAVSALPLTISRAGKGKGGQRRFNALASVSSFLKQGC